jgi:hypothetical protein
MVDVLFRNQPGVQWHYYGLSSHAMWPAMLPSHRGVMAAHLLIDLADGSDYGRDDGSAALPALAEGSGPCGPAVAGALAFALGSSREQARIAGVDAAVTLATTGDLDGTAIGNALRTHLRNDLTKIVWITPALTELANAGLADATWAIASRALAAVLPLPKVPPGTPDLLALASKAVAGRPGLTPLPELGPVAARTGNSRLVTEARRLQRLLPGE